MGGKDRRLLPNYLGNLGTQAACLSIVVLTGGCRLTRGQCQGQCFILVRLVPLKTVEKQVVGFNCDHGSLHRQASIVILPCGTID